MSEYIFERDYSDKYEMAELTWNEDEAAMLSLLKESGFFKICRQKMDAVPRVVNPARRREFQQLLILCDIFAEENGYRIQGELDKGVAFIAISAVGVLYLSREEMATLERIAALADGVLIQGGCNGNVNMEIFIDCREEAAEDKADRAPFEEAISEAGAGRG